MFTRLTSLAGLIMLLLALPILFFGAGLFLFGLVWFLQGRCAPNAPVCRSLPIAYPLLGALVVGVGIAHAIVGIGIVRNGRRSKVVGLVISLVGAALAAYVGRTAFEPLGGHVGRAGNWITDYNNTSIAIAVAFVPYGLAALILLLALRQRQPDAA